MTDVFYSAELIDAGYDRIGFSIYEKDHHILRLHKVHMDRWGIYELYCEEVDTKDAFLERERLAGLEEKRREKAYREIDRDRARLKFLIESYDKGDRNINCYVCNNSIDITGRGYDRHHTSYFPEVIIPLHRRCHEYITMHKYIFVLIQPPRGHARRYYKKQKLSPNILVNRHIINRDNLRVAIPLRPRTNPVALHHYKDRGFIADPKIHETDYKGYYF